MEDNHLLGALFVIGICIFLIWATKKTVEDFKGKKATATQIFQIILIDYVYFTLFFMDLLFPSSSTTWWIISALACVGMFLISEWKGDWIGGIYQKAIKPYKSIYKAIAILCFALLIIGSYALAYMTWKGTIRPGFILSAYASALITIVGMAVDLFGYANGIWLLFIHERDEEEKRVVTVLSFILVWILIGICLRFIWHLSFIMSAVIGIVVLMYFMVPAWGGEYPGILSGFLPSVIHIVSLLCIGALILPLITV